MGRARDDGAAMTSKSCPVGAFLLLATNCSLTVFSLNETRGARAEADFLQLLLQKWGWKNDTAILFPPAACFPFFPSSSFSLFFLGNTSEEGAKLTNESDAFPNCQAL